MESEYCEFIAGYFGSTTAVASRSGTSSHLVRRHFCYPALHLPSADDAQLRICDTSFPVKQSLFIESNWITFRSFKKAPFIPSADIMHILRSKTHISHSSDSVEALGT